MIETNKEKQKEAEMMTPERKDELTELAHRIRRIPAEPQFACMECGHKFRTIVAAEKAAFGDCGCPKCGGADIDTA